MYLIHVRLVEKTNTFKGHVFSTYFIVYQDSKGNRHTLNAKLSNKAESVWEELTDKKEGKTNHLDLNVNVSEAGDTKEESAKADAFLGFSQKKNEITGKYDYRVDKDGRKILELVFKNLNEGMLSKVSYDGWANAPRKSVDPHEVFDNGIDFDKLPF